MIKLSVVLCACVGLASLGSNSTFAQETAAPPKVPTVNGGNIINGKAKNLVKPEYPAEARAAGAEGAVNVQVTVDENGDVISASAVGGHPLLRAAAVAAARASKFTPTQLSGQPVKFSGVVVYNFVAGKPTWYNIGMILSNAERVPTLQFFNAGAINKTIPHEWTTERQQIERLNELKQAEQQSTAEPKPTETVVGEKVETAPNGASVKTRTTAVRLPPNKKMQPEQAALAQSLIASLQSRLSANPLDLWHFTLGVELHRTLGKLSSPNERQTAVETLRRHVESAPAEVSPQVVGELNKILIVFGENGFDAAKRQQINLALQDLNKVLPRAQ